MSAFLTRFSKKNGFRTSAPAHRRATRLFLECLEERATPSGTTAYGQVPLSFEVNQGQTDPRVNFLARGSGYALFLTPGGATLNLQRAADPAAGGDVVQLSLVGTNANAPAQGQNPLPGVANYLVGNDPSQWHTNVPTYAQVAYQNIYPGVDVVYHGNQGQLEYDLVVNSGASPGVIRLAIQGTGSVHLDAQGQLVLRTAGGDVIEHAPVVYQEVNGVRHGVAGRFVLQDGGQLGFAVGAYDHTKPLVIDPVLVYSTYLGGSGGEQGNGIALDSAGSAYLTGWTRSTDFPTVGSPVQGSQAGGFDAFVVKLNAQGSAVDYATYLGGSSNDKGNAIAVDSSGHAYIAGQTSSTNFPTTNALQQRFGGATAGTGDAFIAELNATGSGLVFSTYLGGAADDQANGIALDGSGNIYVAGSTLSSNFPTTTGAFQTAYKGGTSVGDAFVTKLNAGGASLAYSTYLGGTNDDQANAIAVDASGNAYVAGSTVSTNFPTVNAAQPAHASDNGLDDAFVAQLNPAGSNLVYSTYLGGTDDDIAQALAIDGSGNAYVTGFTLSSNFPTAGTPFHAAPSGTGTHEQAFVAKVASGTGVLNYSTYLGGSGNDVGYGIAVDPSGNAYVVGETSSSDFPTTANGQQTTYGGGNDAFLAKLNPAGSSLAYGTFLGGASTDYAQAVAVDAGGNAYLTGNSHSSNFPTANAIQGQLGGFYTAFVAKIGSHIWQGQDVSVDGNGNARLLWNTPTGLGDVWSISSSLTPTPGSTYGPVAGWTPIADGVGSDNFTRILWSNGSGSAALWTVAADGTLQKAQVFGPLNNWTAQDVTIDSNNNARVLWTKSNGQVVVWSVDGSGNVTSSPVYGPYLNWSAVRLEAGSDGLIRLLWTNTDGSAALWLLNSNGSFNSFGVFGAQSGWTAVDVTVGSDNHSRILWASTNGAAAIWNLDIGLNVATSTVVGGFSGWSAVGLAGGADGSLRLLWDHLSGADAVWLLGNDGTVQNSAAYGPF